MDYGEYEAIVGGGACLGHPFLRPWYSWKDQFLLMAVETIDGSVHRLARGGETLEEEGKEVFGSHYRRVG